MIDYANQRPRRRSRGFRNFLVSSALITAVWGLSIYGSQTELGQDFRKYFIEAGVKDCEIIHKRPGKGDNNTEFVERHKGNTKVSTRELVRLLSEDNPKIDSQKSIEGKTGFIFPWEDYKLRKNCKLDYGRFADWF